NHGLPRGAAVEARHRRLARDRRRAFRLARAPYACRLRLQGEEQYRPQTNERAACRPGGRARRAGTKGSISASMAEPVLELDELTVKFHLKRGELKAVDGV